MLPTESNSKIFALQHIPYKRFCLCRILSVRFGKFLDQLIISRYRSYILKHNQIIIFRNPAPSRATPSLGGGRRGKKCIRPNTSRSLSGHPLLRRGQGEVTYITFSTCSLICSSSSFILTTMFCISAWLDLEPVVLISRPISWAMKPSFLPWP